jgi:hypothetical protein
MPVCPQCETEYLEGTTTCADCNVALVAELATSAAEDQELVEHTVLVHEAANELESQAIVSLLEAEGIASAVRTNPKQAVYPMVLTSPSGLGIFVLEEHEHRARELVLRFIQSKADAGS